MFNISEFEFLMHIAGLNYLATLDANRLQLQLKIQNFIMLITKMKVLNLKQLKPIISSILGIQSLLDVIYPFAH